MTQLTNPKGYPPASLDEEISEWAYPSLSL